jgi:hypothetical protein
MIAKNIGLCQEILDEATERFRRLSVSVDDVLRIACLVLASRHSPAVAGYASRIEEQTGPKTRRSLRLREQDWQKIEEFKAGLSEELDREVSLSEVVMMLLLWVNDAITQKNIRETIVAE